MNRVLISIVFVALLASCRSTRNIQTAITKKDTTVKVTVPEVKTNDTLQTIRGYLDDIKKNYINYQVFIAKVDVDYRGGDGKKYDVNASLRMYKDSAIWISANAILGIEALRVLITKDSVKVLDKLNKTYTARSVSYLQELSELPLDLYTLQDLIMGNPVFLDSNVTYYSAGKGEISLLSVGRWFKNLLTVSEANKVILRSKLDDADIARNRTAELNYSDYENKTGVMFATKRNIIVAEKNRLEIKLNFKQYEFSGEISFPFSVPKNYERL